MNYLIGISGKAGHGKDSVAEILKNNFLRDAPTTEFIVLKFADTLKRITSELLDVDRSYMEEQNLKMVPIKHMGGITARKALQFIGTEIGRNIYDGIWIYHYLKQVSKFFILGRYKDNCIVFTPDVRFENEYKAIREFKHSFYETKNILIRVERPGFSSKIDGNHPSEIGLDHIDNWSYKIVAKDMNELIIETEKVYNSIKRY